MGLAVDVSSPAVATTAAQANATAAFTPPADGLQVALWAGNTGGADPPAPSFASSPAHTWTRDAWDHANSGAPTMLGQAAVWHSAVAGSPGSSTATATNGLSSQCDSALALQVVTGHDPVTPVGAAGGSRQQNGTSITVVYLATVTGSLGMLVACDWQTGAVASVTPGAGCSVVAAGQVGTAISYIVLARAAPDGVSGTYTALEVDNLTAGGDWHFCWVELLPSAPAGPAEVSQGTDVLRDVGVGLW